VNAATRERHPDLLPMLDCPGWDRCSAPICPLDRGMAQRVAVDGCATGGIREKRCTLPKSERMELGRDLPWLGLKPRELAGTRQWAGATSEERSGKARQLAVGRDQVAITNALGTQVLRQVFPICVCPVLHDHRGSRARGGCRARRTCRKPDSAIQAWLPSTAIWAASPRGRDGETPAAFGGSGRPRKSLAVD